MTRTSDIEIDLVLGSCGEVLVPGETRSLPLPVSEFVDARGDFAGRINTYYAVPAYLKLGVFMDDKLAADEARRSVQHESVKANVEGEVQAEIADQAQAPATGESQKIREVAGEFRSKAVNEVIDTEREVERGRGAARVSQIVDYIFYVIYALLGMRFLLALMAARSTAGFVQFIVTVTNPFYAPFRGIVASPSTDQGHTLLLPIVIAIIAYVLLHLAINGLLRMLAHRKTQI
jgi:hypothetical protein